MLKNSRFSKFSKIKLFIFKGNLSNLKLFMHLFNIPGHILALFEK